MSAENAGPVDMDFIFSVLLIECVNNPQPMTFLTKEPLVPFLHHHDIKLAGLPLKIVDEKQKDSWERLADFLGMEKYHHYCIGRIATQYCSFQQKKSGKKNEWMAIHEGSHFDTFRKLCDATDYFVDRRFKSWIFKKNESVSIEFFYPVLVLQGELLEAIPGKRSLSLRSRDHLQFRRSSIVRDKQIDYQIDIITEQFLPKLLSIIEQEISNTAQLLKRRHRIVRQSINKITEAAIDLKTPEEIKNVMDYDY